MEPQEYEVDITVSIKRRHTWQKEHDCSMTVTGTLDMLNALDLGGAPTAMFRIVVKQAMEQKPEQPEETE